MIFFSIKSGLGGGERIIKINTVLLWCPFEVNFRLIASSTSGVLARPGGAPVAGGQPTCDYRLSVQGMDVV